MMGIADAFVSAASALFPARQQFVNASLENPRFSLNDPAAYEYLAGGSKSAAGVSVTHENCITLGGVYQAVSLVSGDISKLPLYPFKRLPEDDREIADKHRSYFPVAVRANPYESARRFWRTFAVHCLIWSNGYGYIDRTINGIELYHLLPDRTCPEWVKVPDATKRDGYRMEYMFATEVDGRLEYLTPNRVFHVAGLSLDGSKGADLVQAARDEWGLALAQRNFQSKFFKNGARMGGTLELPAGMSKPARDNVEEGFRKSYEEGDNPFKTVILRDSAKFHAGQVTPEQSQLTDSRDQEKREMASFFNIPPSKLGIRDSVSYNSFEQDNLAYLHGCLHHWLDPIADEANMKLLTEDELRKDTYYFEHNYSKFIQADWRTLNEGLEVMRRNEIINADEWRRKLNMNKRPDGGGGEYINPNTRAANTADAKPAKEEKPAKPEKKADTKNMAEELSPLLAASTASLSEGFAAAIAKQTEEINAAAAPLSDGIAEAVIAKFEAVITDATAEQAKVTAAAIKEFAASANEHGKILDQACGVIADEVSKQKDAVALIVESKTNAFIREAHRPIMANTLERFARRFAAEGRKASRTTGAFDKWLKENHAVMFDDFARATAIAVASVCNKKPEEVLEQSRKELLLPVTALLRESLANLGKGEQLEAKTEVLFVDFEKNSPERVAAKIMETTNV